MGVASASKAEGPSYFLRLHDLEEMGAGVHFLESLKRDYRSLPAGPIQYGLPPTPQNPMFLSDYVFYEFSFWKKSYF